MHLKDEWLNRHDFSSQLWIMQCDSLNEITMQTATQLKAAPTTNHSPLTKARQPAIAAPMVTGIEAPASDTQWEHAIRASHSFGAISVFPSTPPIQPKRMVESAQRLSAFRPTGQGRTNPAPVIPAGWAMLPRVQAKLTIGEPNDAYEQEADRVADQVMQMAEPRVQAKCACGGEAGPDGECAACRKHRAAATLQRATLGSDPLNGVPPIVYDVLRSPGQPLDPDTRTFMEPRFGQDFSGVQVHTDTQAAQSARAVNARAYTVGRDVVFAAGHHAPESAAGRKLLAHELVHVVQQSHDISPALYRTVNATPQLQPSPPDPHARALLVHLHANEQNAAATAATMFSDRCTNFVNLAGTVATDRAVHVTAGGHTIDVDPNRIFTPEGREAQVRSGVNGLGLARPAAVAAQAALAADLDSFANNLIDKIGRGRLGPGGSLLGPLPIIAFHNNALGDARTRSRPATPTSRRTGPGLSIRSYLSSDPRQPSSFRPADRLATDPHTPPHIEPSQSEDDFFLTTDAADFTALSTGTVTSGGRRNVVLQGAGAPNDGSLSVAVQQGSATAATANTLPAGTTQAQAGRYINIEAGGKRPNPTVLATNAALAQDALDLAGAGLRASGCVRPGASVPAQTATPRSDTRTIQPKLAPTHELMRQSEDAAGSTRVARPADTVDDTRVSGNNPASDANLLELLLRAIREVIHVLDRLNTMPPARAAQALPPSTSTCRTFVDEAALNGRKQAWINTLASMPVAEVIAWITGFGSGAVITRAHNEAEQQILCMLRAMQASRTVANLPTGRSSTPSLNSPWVVSQTRDFRRQSAIWNCKFDFRPAADRSCEVSFGRVTAAAVAACPSAALSEGGTWHRGNATHRTCWNSLTPDQRQREILTTSSAPGMSRHHQGTDFDLFSTSPAQFETGATFADAYSWLQANAIQYGFVQSFDALSTFMRLGYTEERWHWSYYPIAQALLEFARDHLPDLESRLLREWGTSSQFSFIRDHWQEFLFNVHQTPTP